MCSIPNGFRDRAISLCGSKIVHKKYILRTATCISDFRRGFGSVNRFIECSPGGTTINYNTFNLTVPITLYNYE
jgi:hypothetical protein